MYAPEFVHAADATNVAKTKRITRKIGFMRPTFKMSHGRSGPLAPAPYPRRRAALAIGGSISAFALHILSAGRAQPSDVDRRHALGLLADRAHRPGTACRKPAAWPGVSACGRVDTHS